MAGQDGVVLNDRILTAIKSIESRVGSVLLGKDPQVRLATAALLAGQHLLVRDLPGTGKTTLGAALARVIGGSFRRVQGTPDLMATDLVGSSIYSPVTGRWTFRPGPLVGNVVLIDELNRISPRTQSALLEAMAEGQVTVDGESRQLPDPFMVVATMNPIGSAGTFPLSAAQLDRFGVTVGLGPVDRETERRLLKGEGGPETASGLEPVLPVELMPELQTLVAAVHCSDPLIEYVLDLCDLLRPTGHLSARAGRAIVATSKGMAALEGRTFVVPDDIKALAVPCLAHRLSAEGHEIDQHAPLVRSVVEELPVPDAHR